MRTINTIKRALLGVALALPMVWSGQSLAGGVALTLQRAALNNDADVAGTWQHEAGVVLKGATIVGRYIVVRRVTAGGSVQLNNGTETVTLFFTGFGVSPAQNVTLQGAHDFTSGNFTGSVSAGSNRYTWVQGADARMIPTATVGTSTLTILWNGSNQLTLP